MNKPWINVHYSIFNCEQTAYELEWDARGNICHIKLHGWVETILIQNVLVTHSVKKNLTMCLTETFKTLLCIPPPPPFNGK